MSEHDLDRIDPLDAGLQKTMSGVLLTRALRERREALDRVVELEAEVARLRKIEKAARELLDNCDQDSAPHASAKLEKLLDDRP